VLLLAESQVFPFALLTPLIFQFVRRHNSTMRSVPRHLTVGLVGLALFAFISSLIQWAMFNSWQATSFAAQFAAYLLIVLAAHAYHYFEKSRRLEVERGEFQRALADRESQALRMQIRPHFLFNTLHGISTLMDSDRASAKTMVLKLSSFLRRTLEHSDSDLISLREELQFAREYLDLEKMRLGKRLNIAWSIDRETMGALVPQLILQPLVENAVRHGVSQSRDGGWIEITSRKHEGVLEIRISNSIGGRNTPGMGIGLQNTDARLRHLYSDDARFSFVKSGENMATATIVIPALTFYEGRLSDFDPANGSLLSVAGD
jgi:sensor histidine kinase YesM